MKDFLELRRDEFTKYFEELPDLNSLRVPSRTFDKSKNKLKEAIIIWKETQHKYIKALGEKNYKEIETVISKISKINI